MASHRRGLPTKLQRLCACQPLPEAGQHSDGLRILTDLGRNGTVLVRARKLTMLSLECVPPAARRAQLHAECALGRLRTAAEKGPSTFGGCHPGGPESKVGRKAAKQRHRRQPKWTFTVTNIQAVGSNANTCIGDE